MMMQNLDFVERNSRSARTDCLVVFLHGYRANGADLIGLSDVLSEEFPTAKFVAPDAPEPCLTNFDRNQWFRLPQFDGSTDSEVALSFTSSYVSFNNFLDEQISAAGVEDARTILFGFSQGAMVALHVGPRRVDQLGGVISASGSLLAPESLDAEWESRPPILLLHGAKDKVVPASSMPEAEKALKDNGFSVRSYLSRRSGHVIPKDSLKVATEFMREVLAN